MVYEKKKELIEDLFDKIDKLIVIKGKVSTDPTIYEYHIGKKVIRVCAEKLDSPREFRRQYQKVMYLPCKRFTNSEWDELNFELVKKRKIIDGPEESEYVFKAREIFEIICDYEISTAAEDALNGRSFYQHEENCYLTSRKVKEIVDTFGFHIPFNILSSTMTELGLKKEGTFVIRLSGKPTRCWSFISAKIREMKE